MEPVNSTPATPNDVITIDRSMLVDLVKGIMEQVQAQSAQGSFNMKELGDTIGEAVALGISKTTRRKVTIAEYMARSAHRPKLKRDTWQCGYFIGQAGEHGGSLTDEQVHLFNRLTHTGRYLDRLVEVLVYNEGSEEKCEVRWNCATADQRNEVALKFGGLTSVLQRIVKIQEDEDREAEWQAHERQESRKRYEESRQALDAQAAAEASKVASTPDPVAKPEITFGAKSKHLQEARQQAQERAHGR